MDAGGGLDFLLGRCSHRTMPFNQLESKSFYSIQLSYLGINQLSLLDGWMDGAKTL